MSLTDKYMVQSVFYAVKVRKIKYKKIDPKKLEKKIIRLNKRLQNAEKKQLNY